MLSTLLSRPAPRLSARAMSSLAAPLAPLLSTDEVQRLVDAQEQRVRFLDASWYLDKSRSGRAEFAAERVPGAQFFDIEQVADATSTLPHMLPTGGSCAAVAVAG